jgi:uncharacterized protein (DUF433 family)
MTKIHNKPALGMGIYTLPDVSRILKIPQHRIRWYLKIWDNRFGIKEFGEKYSWKADSHPTVNFLVLIEFQIVVYLHDLGVPTRRILLARKEMARDKNTAYPFASTELMSDKRDVFYSEAGQILNAGTRQLNTLVDEYCKKIDFGSDYAERLWPDGRDSSVVVNPRHQFGSPVIDGTNIKVSTLYSMHQSGESIPILSALYELSPNKIQDAIRFYARKAA